MAGLGFVILEVGVFALVLVLLNARDRRRARAIADVLGARPATLRDSVALRARAPLWRRRVVVTLDLSACDHVDVWSTARQFAAALPPRVALVVSAKLGPTRSAAISVRAWDAVYRERAS